MPRIVQTVAFFVLIGAGYVALGPFSNYGALLGFLLSWSIIAATITYVIPWLFFRLNTEPVGPSNKP